MTISSPCVAVCELNEDHICTGCLRSLDEIGDWGGASDAQREQILEQVRIRRTEFDTT